MSLTLRDAQHLCWKTFKKFETFDQKGTTVFTNPAYLPQKVAEIAQKIKTTDSDEAAKKEAIAKMLSELLFAACVLAEQQGVNLEESFLQTVDEMILAFVS
jgi:NTP pyrophosphatase (non-canonical NTP hydrolase)